MMVGTASFLAPEQVAGEPVGPPADVYALGLVLLECLTGQREYAGSTVEVALARLQRSPRVPDTLPDGWPGLLRAMTAREPADRPKPADAARDLSAIATGGQATTVLPGRQAFAAPPPLPPRERTQVLSQTSAVPRPEVAPRPVAPPPSRTNWPVVILMLLLVALIAAGAVYLLSERSGTTEPLPAVELDLPEQLRNDLQELQREVES
jgi:serine/threonine protein kinase